MAALVAGCAADVDGQGVAEGVDTRSQALRYQDGSGTVYNQDVFARDIEVTPSDGSTIFPTLDPALCGDEEKAFEYLVVSRDAQKRLRMIHHTFHEFSAWKILDDDETNPRKFNSQPACAALELAQNGDARFLVVGKGDDNRLYASTGSVPPTDFSGFPDFIPSSPTVEQDWDDLNSRSYGSGSGCPSSGCTDPGPANPALASKKGINLPGTPGTTGAIVLVFISGSTVYAHYHSLPYAGNNWQARVAAPPLPGSATPVGTPAITFRPGPSSDVFHIVVRAEVNGQNRFYETAFGRTQTGPSSYGPGFCDLTFCGSSGPSWRQLPITGAIDSSPTLEFYALHGETLYFRRGTNLMQTSGDAVQQLGTLPLLEVHPGNTVAFTGAPAALGGVRQEFGNHLVVSRTTSNELYLDESLHDDYVAQ